MTNQKKIAVLCNYKLLSERIGGMDYFFWMFDKKCKENNIQVHWFFPNTSTYGDYKYFNTKASNDKAIEPFFIEYLKQNQTIYTHIITHFIELCTPFFKEMKQVSNAKIIAVDHNPRPLNGYSLKKKITKRIKGILYAKYIDVFVGVSNYSSNQLIIEFGSQIKDKSIVIFNGLEIEKFKKKANFDSYNKFIIASHLRKDKGIQDVIDAVNKLRNQVDLNFIIDIYGEGYYEKYLKNKIEVLSLQKYFNFKGNVTNLHELYSNYDYLIHPSHGETFCYSVVESLLSNLPVITTNNQGNVLGLIKENSNGFLFNVADTNRLKDILKSILNQEIKIENGLQKEPYVTNLLLEKMVENHFKLLK